MQRVCTILLYVFGALCIVTGSVFVVVLTVAFLSGKALAGDIPPPPGERPEQIEHYADIAIHDRITGWHVIEGVEVPEGYTCVSLRNHFAKATAGPSEYDIDKVQAICRFYVQGKRISEKKTWVKAVEPETCRFYVSPFQGKKQC